MAVDVNRKCSRLLRTTPCKLSTSLGGSVGIKVDVKRKCLRVLE